MLLDAGLRRKEKYEKIISCLDFSRTVYAIVLLDGALRHEEVDSAKRRSVAYARSGRVVFWA